MVTRATLLINAFLKSSPAISSDMNLWNRPESVASINIMLLAAMKSIVSLHHSIHFKLGWPEPRMIVYLVRSLPVIPYIHRSGQP